MSAMSGASTYAIGQVAISQFSAGRSFTAMDPDAAKRAYEHHFKKGKDVAEELSKNKGKSRDTFEKLTELAKLRDQGVITAEDFEAQKRRLLAEV